MLDGPHIVEFDHYDKENFHIKIEQNGIRKIIITADKEVSIHELNIVLTKVERLLIPLQMK